VGVGVGGVNEEEGGVRIRWRACEGGGVCRGVVRKSKVGEEGNLPSALAGKGYKHLELESLRVEVVRGPYLWGGNGYGMEEQV